MLRGTRWFIILALLAFAAILCADDTGDDEARRLYQSACVQCHALRPIEATRDGRSGWEDTVHKMIVIGAQLNSAEMDTVVDYLARHYGPAAGDPLRTGLLPPGAPLQEPGSAANGTVELPEGPGQQLVEAHCTICHDAGRIVATRRSAEDWRRYAVNMAAQGDMSITPEILQDMVSYLNRHFGQPDSAAE
jgi:cytochrome c5